MNCECVKTIEETTEGHIWNGRKILSAKLKEIVFAIGEKSIDLITCSHFEAELEGRKSIQLITVNHSYCPFCGTKIGKPDTEQVSEPLNPESDAAKN